jgi:ATP-dependent RNA helicase DDX51/DBP6
MESSHSCSFIRDDDNSNPKSTFPLSDLMPDGVAPTFTSCLPFPVVPVTHTDHKMTSCQKLLFSATLTRDPSKIATLDLRDPKYFIVQGSDEGEMLDVAMEEFSMPSTLIVRINPFFHMMYQTDLMLVFRSEWLSPLRCRNH